ncbi:ABC transporter permease [Paenibacillus filicis]|uniref:ABC transporter permease n=1 Tax=Paenibacillus gyeongsangnamensis TaxID=3388067 RepID=A0ABT4QLG2_9BACL|nr:ABC transporter permease [Paenibacillus filicis]MCZ8517695.1 ABC transporter permease [Paenibacillus filicis]
MTSLLRLIQNEQMKIYARVRTWIMLGILVLAVIAMAILMKYVVETGMNHVLQFMSFTTNITGLAFIFAVIVAGDSVAAEYTWGTIKLLLIRPVSRGKILLAKYISVLLFLAVLLLLLVIVSYLVGLVLFGVSGAVSPESTFKLILQAYGFKAVEMVMAVTLAFMISAAFRSSSLAIGLSIFLMLTANSIVMVLASLKYTWVKYLLFANTDLSHYSGGGMPLLSGMTLGFSITVLVIYWLVFYAVSWLIFTRRDVAGG